MLSAITFLIIFLTIRILCRAELRFQGYMARDINGPPSQLVETVRTVYMTQLRTKIITLLSATSFQDWKALTGRQSGGEEFVKGDYMRMIGNVAGRLTGKRGNKDGKDKATSETRGSSGSGFRAVNSSVKAIGGSVTSIGSFVEEGVEATLEGGVVATGNPIQSVTNSVGEARKGIGRSRRKSVKKQPK